MFKIVAAVVIVLFPFSAFAATGENEILKLSPYGEGGVMVLAPEQVQIMPLENQEWVAEEVMVMPPDLYVRHLICKGGSGMKGQLKNKSYNDRKNGPQLKGEV